MNEKCPYCGSSKVLKGEEGLAPVRKYECEDCWRAWEKPDLLYKPKIQDKMRKTNTSLPSIRDDTQMAKLYAHYLLYPLIVLCLITGVIGIIAKNVDAIMAGFCLAGLFLFIAWMIISIAEKDLRDRIEKLREAKIIHEKTDLSNNPGIPTLCPHCGHKFSAPCPTGNFNGLSITCPACKTNWITPKTFTPRGK